MSTIASSPLQTAAGGYPLVGHLPIFLRDRLGFLTRCAEMDAAVVRFRLECDVYLLLDAVDIKHVLETNYPNYDKSERMTSTRGRELSGSGLLTSMGREHLEKRRVLQPLFSPNSIEPFAEIMTAETERFLNRWKEGVEIDAAREMSDLAQCINGRILFSADYHSADAELGEAIRVRRQYILHVFGSLLPFSDRLPSRARTSFKRAQSLINNDIQQRIAQRRAKPGKHSDMLSRFTAALDDHAALDETVTTAITGYETIGEGLAWTCLLLSQHPQVEQKLIDEIRLVLGDRSPTNEDLKRLRYVDMVLNESMRLYPPTWIYVRMSREADLLPSGVQIPAGARLYICPWAIHRSARYFDDPLTFDPARFEDEARKSRPKYAHFPFGGGPRVCIGQWIAKMQMPIMLAMLLQRFKLQLMPGQSIVPDPKITLRPSPAIRMLLRSRKH